MTSTPPAPEPRRQTWLEEVWKNAIALLVAEDSRFKEVRFRLGDEVLEVVSGPAELVELLTSPGWNTVIRSFVRRAANDLNRAETRHALEDPSWPPFLVALPGRPAVQSKSMEGPPAERVAPPRAAAIAAPPSLPPPPPPVPRPPPVTEPHAPAPLRAHPFLEHPIPHEDEIVAMLKGPARRAGDAEMSAASEKMLRVCLRIWAMLDEKNRAYGNSALDPVRVFSKAPLGEQIRVRLDDKISRLARGQAAGEDVVQDLMGYLVLLKVSELPWPPTES